MTQDRKTVAVMVHHGLGDVVMALPMLRDVDERLPDGWNLLLVVKTALEADLVGQIAWRNRVETLMVGTGRGLDSATHLIGAARRIRRMKPAVFLGTHFEPRPSASLFAAIVGAPLSVGQGTPWSGLGYTKPIAPVPDEHKVRWYARFAEGAGLRRESDPLRFPPLRQTAASSRGEPRKTILLAPGSGVWEPHKRWPADGYAKLIQRLHAHDPAWRLALFGAPGEVQLMNDIHARSGLGQQVEIVVPARIEDSLLALAQADCVVCACTGTAHLAAMMERPSVCLFGPTNPAVTGPYSSHANILRLGLACSPCYRPGFVKGCGNPLCMQEISVEQVFALVCRTLRAEFSPLPTGIRTTAATAPDRTRSTSYTSGSNRS